MRRAEMSTSRIKRWARDRSISSWSRALCRILNFCMRHPVTPRLCAAFRRLRVVAAGHARQLTQRHPWQPLGLPHHALKKEGYRMRLVIGSDHAGWSLKQTVIDHVKSLGHEVVDVGSYDDKPVDFPDIARAVAQKLTSGQATRGLMVCGT